MFFHYFSAFGVFVGFFFERADFKKIEIISECLCFLFVCPAGFQKSVLKVRTAVVTQTTFVSGVWCCYKNLHGRTPLLHNVCVLANFAFWEVGSNTMHNHQFGIVQIAGLLWHVQLMQSLKLWCLGSMCLWMQLAFLVRMLVMRCCNLKHNCACMVSLILC